MKKILALVVILPFFTSCLGGGSKSSAYEAMLSVLFLADGVMQIDEEDLPTMEKLTKKNFTLGLLKMANINKGKNTFSKKINALAFSNPTCFVPNEEDLSFEFNNCTYSVDDSELLTEYANEFSTDCDITATTQSLDGTFSGSGDENSINIIYNIKFSGFYNANCKTDININTATIEDILEEIDDIDNLTEEEAEEIINQIIDEIEGKICGLSVREIVNTFESFEDIDTEEEEEELIQEFCKAFK